MENLFNNVVAGIAASTCTFIFVLLYKKITLSRKFAFLEGEYSHQGISGEKYVPGRTVLKHIGGGIILSDGNGTDGEWEGRITMNEKVPEHGVGTYQYKNKKDCGVHQIQFNRRDNSIYVLVSNTSHGRNFNFAYVWKFQKKIKG